MSRAGVVFDVDGTLVDTNYLHVVAWWRAFRAAGHDVPMARLHQHIGQGGDRLVGSILGDHDEAVAAAHSDFYGPALHELVPLPGATALLRAVKARGLAVVLATSASTAEARHLRAALDADELIDATTTADDVDASKPEPDVIATALARGDLDSDRSVVVGDTVWDVEAARRAGLDCVGVLSGGVPAADLRAAGAVAVYRDAAALLASYDDSPLAALSR